MEISAYKTSKLFKIIAIHHSIKMCPSFLLLLSDLFLLAPKKVSGKLNFKKAE